MTDDEQHKISKEMIKQLFSIEIEPGVAQSLHMQKVQRPVVSKELAAMFECPEVSTFALTNEGDWFYNFHSFIFSFALKQTSVDSWKRIRRSSKSSQNITHLAVAFHQHLNES